MGIYMKWLVALTLGIVVQIAACAAEPAVPIPAPALDNEKSAGPLQTAVLAGGCFWGRFYPAEGYHQDFLLRNPSDPYIVFNDLPKIRNFEKTLPALYVPTPVTVQ
ncbi:MAG TPA: hypothetical protein VG994_03380 [Steroidobacteraceae bacterium]|nr:hypothetical protein [Steroidobacteraceae bacterium]